MFTNESPLVSGFRNDRPQYNPQEMEMIMRQKWQNTVPIQTDPLSDFENEFAQCSLSIQKRIREDDEFRQAEAACDACIQHTIQQMVKPYIMQDMNTRMVFERMLANFRQSKDRYIKEEATATEQLQKIMQDEVVQQRIKELNRAPIPIMTEGGAS